MIEVFDFEQGSPDWHRVRLGIPTASEFKSILAKGEGKTRRTYMMKLLGERFTGEPADNFSNGHMERGKEMEDEARRLYAFMQEVDPVRVGFIRNGAKGSSPDSLIGESGGLEIKTKLAHLQLDVIEADKIPSEHVAQVQGHLWIAEREWWDFASYWPKLPLFVKRVTRDEPYIATLRSEVERFTDELDALTEKMVRRGATLSEAVRIAA
jgi:hypothetical protein